MDLLSEGYNQGIELWKLLEEKLALQHLQGRARLWCGLCGVLEEGSSAVKVAKERLQAMWW